MAKVWVSANKIIKHNSELETMDELYGNGYLAKVTARIKELNQLIAEQDEKRAARKKKANDEIEEQCK